MRHRRCGLSTYRLSGLGKGDEHPPTLQEGHDTLYLLSGVDPGYDGFPWKTSAVRIIAAAVFCTSDALPIAQHCHTALKIGYHRTTRPPFRFLFTFYLLTYLLTHQF